MKTLKFMRVCEKKNVLTSYVFKISIRASERALFYVPFRNYGSRSWMNRERIHVLCAKFVINDHRSKSLHCSKSWNWQKDNKGEKCRIAYGIFSQVWRTSRHNRLAKCDTSDHPSVSIVMVIDQLCAIFQLEVFILKTESYHINY